MKTTVRCTQLFCKCGTPVRACRHSVVEPARAMTSGRDGSIALPDGVHASGLASLGEAEKPDFAAQLAEKAQAMIAAFDLLSDEAWASIPEPVWTEIQSAADHLQLALFNFQRDGATA